ncbi:hypothetical protein NI17_019815 [Thermobifida halotolerans]|uniref:Uncharacterized protein n=1 Tax=Thermobifida halotolerans TaxID=483545 RepID=A0A399FVN4_9ACTN|nr:hypothetical protein [Thermobifida halotolerans]UOE18986.1 hypothetical protein NI17_019815 [Thermobifida halotolerans]
MTSHVDPETLALFAEGLLAEDEEQEVRARLAESEEARSQLAALREVPQILASAPVPPMPDGLILRIDEALRDEAKKHPASSGPVATPPAPPDDSTKVRPLRRSGGPARWMPFLAAAAAAVFVLGAGAAVVNGLSSPGSGSPGSETMLVPPATLPPEAALPYRLAVVSSGTDYTSDGLAEQGGSVLDRSALADLDDEPSEDEPLVPSDDEAIPAEVTSCAEALEGAYGTGPTLVDIASYEGEPAWIMFFPVATGDAPDSYELRVAEPNCADVADPTSTIIDTAVISTGQ